MQLQQEYVAAVVCLYTCEFYLFCIIFLVDWFYTFPK